LDISSFNGIVFEFFSSKFVGVEVSKISDISLLFLSEFSSELLFEILSEKSKLYVELILIVKESLLKELSISVPVF